MTNLKKTWFAHEADKDETNFDRFVSMTRVTFTISTREIMENDDNDGMRPAKEVNKLMTEASKVSVHFF